MPLVYSCFSLIWLEVKASCTKKPARCLHFYLCAASNSYGLCLSPFLSFSSLSLCHSSSSPSISLICVFRCAFMRVCCPPLYTCACFLLPAPLRKAKFVESPRIPQSELGFPTNTSTTARNPDLDTYFPGKFFYVAPCVSTKAYEKWVKLMSLVVFSHQLLWDKTPRSLIKSLVPTVPILIASSLSDSLILLCCFLWACLVATTVLC